MARREVNVTWISIRRYEQQNMAVIRLNVDAEKRSQLLDGGFWPSGITCRPMHSKAQYWNKVLNCSNHARKTTPEAALHTHIILRTINTMRVKLAP